MATVIESSQVQQVRIKKEVTYGTPPAAIDTRLNALRIIPHKMIDAEGFAASGSTAISTMSINDNYTTIAVRGKLSFTDIMYILSSMIGAPVTTTPGGATLARQHVFTWDGITPIAPNSYTIHYGTGTIAREVPGVVFNGLSWTTARDNNIEMTSGGFGKKLKRGITGASTPPFAASPTDLAAVPIFATYFDVYLDTTWAGLGTTQYLQMMSLQLQMADRLGRVRPISSTGAADGLVELENQTHTLQIQVAADATGDALLDVADTGAYRYLRLIAAAPANSIESGQTYTLKLDIALLITGVSEYQSAQGGVHVITYTAQIARDLTSGNAMVATVINKMTAIA